MFNIFGGIFLINVVLLTAKLMQKKSNLSLFASEVVVFVIEFGKDLFKMHRFSLQKQFFKLIMPLLAKYMNILRKNVGCLNAT